jgi:hypothetical protein
MKIGTNVNLGYPFRIPTVVVTHTFDCSSTCWLFNITHVWLRSRNLKNGFKSTRKDLLAKREGMLVRRCKPIVLELNDQYQVSYMRVPNLVLSQCWASLSYGVAEFRRLGKIRFQSTRLKYGLQSIQELIIIGSIYT